MPRQDVPYGGAICRLKERIAEIWDKLGEKLHSVNGVEGDAAGDVKIVSTDPAVVITNNAASHEIEIGLDSLELPAAAVSSVNRQTGAVALDAGDIPSDNGNVQTDLDALALRVTANGTAISNEVTDRQNADNALQTNINTVSANIPEMSVTPDPYKGVERDAQGRAFAADPASGATDKSLTTANWISQTGNAAPNNLVHRSGDEDVFGFKNMIVGYHIAYLPTSTDFYTWYKVGKIKEMTCSRLTYCVNLPYNNTTHIFIDAFVVTPNIQNSVGTIGLFQMAKSISDYLPQTEYLGIAYDGTDYYLYVKTAQYTIHSLFATYTMEGGYGRDAHGIITPITPVKEDPTTHTHYVII